MSQIHTFSIFPLSTSWFRISSPLTWTSLLTGPVLPSFIHSSHWSLSDLSQTDNPVSLLPQTPQWSSRSLSIKFKLHNMVCVGPASLATPSLVQLQGTSAASSVSVSPVPGASSPFRTLSWLTLTHPSGVYVNNSSSCTSALIPPVWVKCPYTVLS